MKLIEVTRGWVTQVDDEQFDELSQHEWYAMKRGYVCRRDSSAPGSPIILMHRHIMRSELSHSDLIDPQVDHRDGNPLNNQRFNLRICTHPKNCCNQSLNRSNQCGFKGVTFMKADGNWRARIKTNGVFVYLGRFQTKELAAVAYNEASLKYHGEFGKLNVIPETPPSSCSPQTETPALCESPACPGTGRFAPSSATVRRGDIASRD